MSVIAQFGKFAPMRLMEKESVEAIDKMYGFQYVVCYWRIKKYNASYNSKPKPIQRKSETRISTYYLL